MLKFFKHIYSYIREKTQNPFLDLDQIKSPFGGTFITIWIIKHWQFAYTIFYFDPETSRLDRLAIIKDLFKNEDWGSLLWKPLGWTFLSIVFFYTASATALFAAKFYHNWLVPIITRLSDNKSVIDKETHDKLREHALVMQSKYSELLAELQTNQTDFKQKETLIRQEADNKIKSNSSQILMLQDFYRITNTMHPEFVLGKSNEEVLCSSYSKPDIAGSKNINKKVVLIEGKDLPKGWKVLSTKFADKLYDAPWIANEFPISTEEATVGGTYCLIYDFVNHYQSGYFESLYLHCVVDDYLKVFFNGNLLTDTRGREEAQNNKQLISYDLLRLVNDGNNRIELFVRNESHQELRTGLENPYGIAFSIVGKNKDISEIR